MFSIRTVTNISQWLIRIGIIGALISPLLIGASTIWPFIITKSLLFYVSVELAVGGWALLMTIRPEFRPRISWPQNFIILAAAAFLLVNIIAAVFGASWSFSFWSSLERMGGLLHLIHLCAFLLVLVYAVRRLEEWNSILTIGVVVSFLMSLTGLAQWLGDTVLVDGAGGPRLGGSTGNPNYLAAYLLFQLFFLLYFIVKPKRFDFRVCLASFILFDAYFGVVALLHTAFLQNNWGQLSFLKSSLVTDSFHHPAAPLLFVIVQAGLLLLWQLRHDTRIVRGILVFFLLFNFFIFILTQSRGALLGLLVGIIILIGISYRTLPSRIRLWGIFAIGLIIASVITVFIAQKFLISHPIPLISRLANISLTDITSQDRLFVWRAAWEGWTANPKNFLIGVGPENFSVAFEPYYPVGLFRDFGSPMWYDRAHNVIFDIGLSSGLVGLLVYGTFLAIAGWFLLSHSNEYRDDGVSRRIFFAALIAYAVQNLFGFDTLNSEIPLYLLFGLASFYYYRNQNEAVTSQLLKPNSLLISTLALVMIFVMYLVNVGPALAAADVGYAQELVANGPPNTLNPDAVSIFKRGIQESAIGRGDSIIRLGDYLIKNLGNNQPSSDLKPTFDYVINAMQQQLSAEPLNLRGMYFLAKAYGSESSLDPNAINKSEEYLLAALKICQTRPQLYFDLGKVYATMGNLQLADSYMKKGIDLAPDVVDSHKYLFEFYILSKQFDAADQEYQVFRTLQVARDPGYLAYADQWPEFVDMYTTVKNWPKAIEFQQKVIETNPSGDAYSRLAGLWAKVGDTQQAETAARKAVELDPRLKDDLNTFLLQLKNGQLRDEVK